MIVSRRHRFVFVSAPRCGTNTIYRALIEHFGGQRRALKIGLHPTDLVPGLRRAVAGYLVWGIVRDPYARMVSNWSWSRGSKAFFPVTDGMRFERYCEFVATAKDAEYAAVGRPRFETLTARFTPMDVQRFVRMEHLEGDLAELPFWRPVPLYREYFKPTESE